jgi:phage-related protein
MPKRKPEPEQVPTVPKKQIFYTPQARQFLDALAEDVQSEFEIKFQSLARDGFLEFPAGRKLDRGLFEVRVAMTGNAYRVFYCYDTGTAIWALSGFVKKTQQTPIQEIAKALKIKRSIGL